MIASFKKNLETYLYQQASGVFQQNFWSYCHQSCQRNYFEAKYGLVILPNQFFISQINALKQT